MVRLFILKSLRNGNLRCFFALITLIIFLLSGITFSSDLTLLSTTTLNKLQKAQISGERIDTTEWLKNPSFESSDGSWFSTIEGDSSDVNATINNGEASIEILGTKGIFNITETTPSEDLWKAVSNPEYPSMPKDYSINTDGWYVSHQWEDNEPQNPCIHWERNVSIPINLLDYTITSASVNAVVNATVDAYPGAPSQGGSGVDVPGDIIDSYDLFDYVRMYILISDIDKSKQPYEIAYYQTRELGNDSAGGIDYLFDTFMIPVSEKTLIFYLNQVLHNNRQNFTICLGMRFWCEDNFDFYDEDNWRSVMIKNFSFIFTFEKKIDQFTSVAWNQISSRICDISAYNIEVTEAVFNFKYKINQKWHNSSSNSEIKTFINNIRVLHILKLIEYNNSPFYQYAKTGGFNVKSLISNDMNISVSIQVYLADEFDLDHKIEISIDDVTLEISYIEFIPTASSSFLLLWTVIILLLVIVGVLSGLILRSYILMPRKIKRRTALLARTQKFKDVENIQGILIIHNLSGLPLFSKNYSDLMEDKKTLFSGFIQAISIVGEEISNRKYTKSKKSQSDLIDGIYKVIELDFRHFYCLISDVEELRTVLILRNKASKRLKKQMLNFALSVYANFSEILKDWNHELNQFQDEIPVFIKNYFNLDYKEFFKLTIKRSDLENIKRELKLSRDDYNTLVDIISISEENPIFKLISILKKLGYKSEDLVIDTIEVLIKKNLLIPADSIEFQV
jgi:hypothetical protein